MPLIPMTPEQQSAFTKFKNKLARAHQLDARLEYLDKGYKQAKEAWAEADQAEQEFKELFPC